MRRKLVSLSIGLVFLVLIGTGILMYLRPFDKGVASLHTIFGLLFTTVAMMHIWNNLVPIRNYTRKNGTTWRIGKPFLVLSFLISFLSYISYTGEFGFNAIYDWGNEYRSTQLGKEVVSKNFEYISLSETTGRYKIEIEGKLGVAFNYPMFAVWIEDDEGNYIQSVFVSESIGTSTYDYKKGMKGKHIIRRPSALPVWAHRRNIQAADGLMIPLENAPDLDGYTGATPLDDFVIESNVQISEVLKIHVFFEINQSYDWNDYYSKDPISF